jgi:hypothetical protein
MAAPEAGEDADRFEVVMIVSAASRYSRSSVHTGCYLAACMVLAGKPNAPGQARAVMRSSEWVSVITAGVCIPFESLEGRWTC